jgi:hypothetical protein
MAQSQLRGNKQIQSGSITNTEIASDANIALSKIESGSVLSELNGRISNLETNAFVTREIPSGSIDGSNRVYTLANPIVTGSEQVFLNGLLQDPGASDTYTIVGTTITFNTAPLTGDEIHVSYATGNYLVAPGGSVGGAGGGSSVSTFTKQVLTTDGSTTQFALQYAVTYASSLLVVSDGVIQEPGVSYSINESGNTIIFSYAPLTTERVYIVYLAN